MSQGHVSTDSATETRALPGEVPPAELSLILFQAGSAATHVVRLDRPKVIGRGDDCDVVLADGGVSRRHVRLEVTALGVEVEELGSHNGTFVDGRRINRARLGTGSILRLGDTLGLVCALGEPWQAVHEHGPLVGGVVLAPLRRLISLVGPTPLAVSITGETGTGKEILARLLHEASGRNGPFIAVNCAALPEALVDSELFGHARGAFTDARQARKGLFTTASGGTLFLDEVGDLPAAAQAKLLRTLEDGLVRPVGAEAPHQVDVRVLSATNRDLDEAVRQKTFRADLRARLGAVDVQLPPLRARATDLPALSRYLLKRAALAPRELSADALEALALHDWPQNVRELDNTLRSAALTADARIELADLPPRVRERLMRARAEGPDGAPMSLANGTSVSVVLPPAPSSMSPAATGAALSPPPRPRRAPPGPPAKRADVEAALVACGGNVRRVSQLLGIGRGHLYRLFNRWELTPENFRSVAAGTGLAEGSLRDDEL